MTSVVSPGVPIFFHITPTRYFRAILTQGLQPRIGPRSRRCGETAPAAYLFPSIDDLINGCTTWIEKWFGEGAKLGLIAANLSETPHPFPDITWERQVTVSIGPEHLTLLSRDIMGLTENELQSLITSSAFSTASLPSNNMANLRLR